MMPEPVLAGRVMMPIRAWDAVVQGAEVNHRQLFRHLIFRSKDPGARFRVAIYR
jgi:hypothetical protein